MQSDILPANFGKLGDIRIYVSREDEASAQALMKARELEYDKLDDDGETVVTDEGASDIDDNSTLEPDTE